MIFDRLYRSKQELKYRNIISEIEHNIKNYKTVKKSVHPAYSSLFKHKKGPFRDLFKPERPRRGGRRVSNFAYNELIISHLQPPILYLLHE